MMGRANLPSCFKCMQTLPAEHCAKGKVWMTTDIWGNWVRKQDVKLELKGLLGRLMHCTLARAKFESDRVEISPNNT